MNDAATGAVLCLLRNWRRGRTIDVLAWGTAVLALTALLALLWIAPDAADAAPVADFYQRYHRLVLFIIVLIALYFLPQLWAQGLLAAHMRRTEGAGPYTWIAFGSELMFMTVFNVEIGLVATATLLYDRISAEALYILHVGAWVLAAPIAFAGCGYFLAVLALCKRTQLFPRHVRIVAVVSGIGNIGAIGGVFTVHGPFNPADGLIAFGAPTASWILWFAATAGWLVRNSHVGRRGAGENADAGRPDRPVRRT
ncbi:hypothetical protein [Amycolatopsis anabasis]|uniref:hypothetical protein n=1 Tax=Amycolatopsis anabasis TaxID=1840409 RepID=UPI00131D33FE|nr:hypothetical protein [Amycolatopsis anabasis]